MQQRQGLLLLLLLLLNGCYSASCRGRRKASEQSQKDNKQFSEKQMQQKTAGMSVG
jgi:hypothetical protein